MTSKTDCTHSAQSGMSTTGTVLGCFQIWGISLIAATLFSQVTQATQAPLYDSIVRSTQGGSASANKGTWLANQFNTDGIVYQLQSVVLNFSTTPFGTIAVDIYSNAAGSPGSNLGTLTNPSGFSTGTNAFIANNISTLQADSAFWVVLRGVGDGTANWIWTSDNPTGVGDSTHSNLSLDSGATWQGTSSGTPYMMQVNATPAIIPEPSIWAIGLFALGFTAIAARRCC